MNWEELRKDIFEQLQPDCRGILKCHGEERRAITRNDGKLIQMQVGSNSKKHVSYKMIEYAFNRIKQDEIFNAAYFRKRYRQEYPCIYSMVGGILVEMKVSQRHPNGDSCYYTKLNKSFNI